MQSSDKFRLTVIERKGEKLYNRVELLEKGVEALKGETVQTRAALNEMRETQKDANALIIEQLNKFNAEQSKQGRKLAVVRASIFSVLAIGGGTGGVTAATEAETLVSFLKHIVEFFA